MQHDDSGRCLVSSKTASRIGQVRYSGTHTQFVAASRPGRCTPTAMARRNSSETYVLGSYRTAWQAMQPPPVSQFNVMKVTF